MLYKWTLLTCASHFITCHLSIANVTLCEWENVNLREYWNYFLVNECDSAESSVEYVWRWYCNAAIAYTRFHSPRKYKQMRFRNREVANAIASVSNGSDARLSSKLCRSFTKISIRIVKLIAPKILRGLAFVYVPTLQLSSLYKCSTDYSLRRVRIHFSAFYK